MLEPKINDQTGDSLHLGLLHEAVSAFLRQDCLDSFWQCVCENARPLVPAERMCILLQSDQDRCEVVSRLEQGKILPPLELQFDIDQDIVGLTLKKRGVGWLTAPWEDTVNGLDEGQADPLRRWLVENEPEAILTTPIQVNARNVGAIMFVFQTINAADQIRLRSLALGYALHVGTTYTMLRTTAALAVANQNLEAEIAERKQAEAALQDHREQLQKLVAERAGELAATNKQLHREIEERKKTEQALRQSEERYRIVSELTSDYAYAFQIDAAGQLTLDWITGAFTRITGFTKEELVARGGWLTLIHPDDLPVIQARSQRLLSGLTDTSEFRIIAKNEETRWLRDHGRPLWDESREQATAIYGACQDVTERKQTEAALRESEKKFRTLTETTAAGIIIHQGQEFLYVNPAAETITGYSRVELLTMNFWNIVHPDFRPIIRERAEARLQGQMSLSNYELKILTKTGAARWIYLSAGIIEYRSKPAILATAFDITERKTATEALQKIAVENVRLARAVDAAAEGVSISDPNQPNNPLIYVNPAFSHITGYSPDECIGRNCRFLQGPETDPQAVTRIRQALAEQREVQVTILNYRKDGQPFWNELRISPVISKTGQLLYFVGIQSDITHRKQAEKALKESEDRLRTVMEKMPNGVSVIVQGRLVYVNPAVCEMSGYTPDEILDHSPLQFFHPEEREQVATRLRKIVQSGLESASQYRLLKKDGDILPVEIASRPIRFGGESGVLSILHDLTERKRAEEALIYARDQALEASRLKTQLLATVSHELRTPLNAILGFTEILDFGVYGPLTDKQRQTLAEIMDSTHYLTGLVNELLDQAQLEAGKVTLNITDFAPAELVDQVRARMSVLAETKGLRLTGTVAPDVPATVSGDRERVQQILLNLVSNAIKFTEQGEVEMKVHRPNETRWAMTVSDTGLGIAASAQAQIFEPFHQIDASITRKHRGSGLGLSIVKQLIHLMGGQITVDSQEGQGSTFTVLLPIEAPLPQ